jgi:hypothetical protein
MQILHSAKPAAKAKYENARAWVGGNFGKKITGKALAAA